MGSQASKVGRKLPKTVSTQMSNRPPPQYNPSGPGVSETGPSSQVNATASGSKSAAIQRDAQDPDFDSMLRSLGSVNHGNSPADSPDATRITTAKPSTARMAIQHQQVPSVNNPRNKIPDSLLIMQRREQTTQDMISDPNSFLDVFTVREVLRMREGQGTRAMTDEEIEDKLGLKKGILRKLGKSVGDTRQKREQEEIRFVTVG